MVDKKKKAKLLETVGLYLVMKLGWSRRAYAYAIWFLVHELYMQLLISFVIHIDIYGICYIILNDKKKTIKTFAKRKRVSFLYGKSSILVAGIPYLEYFEIFPQVTLTAVGFLSVKNEDYCLFV